MDSKLIVCINRRHAPNPHSCGNNGGIEIAATLEERLNVQGLDIPVERIACMSMCANGPNVQLQPDGRNWQRVGAAEVDEILQLLQERHR